MEEMTETVVKQIAEYGESLHQEVGQLICFPVSSILQSLLIIMSPFHAEEFNGISGLKNTVDFGS